MFSVTVHSKMSNTGLGTRTPGLRTARPLRYSQGSPVASGLGRAVGHSQRIWIYTGSMNREELPYQLREFRMCRLG